MGTFFHPFLLIGPAGASEALEALVDTGSSFTTAPRTVLHRLGVVPFATVRLRLANGQVAEGEIGEVQAEIDGLARRTVICLFGSPDAPPLIGAHALEAFLLTVDPAEQKLVPKEAYLM